MSAIGWFLVVYIGCFVALIFGCAIHEEISSSREWAKYWQRKRILELEARCGIAKKDSWYGDG